MKNIISNWKHYINESFLMNPIDFQTKDTLNPKIWTDEEQLNPEISDKLVQIAKDFFESMRLTWVEIIDITFTGSLANYNWTDFSDIDLHIIVDYRQVDENITLVRDYFNAKRIEWNMKHKIMIKGYEVEIYVQELAEPHASTGVYSVLFNKWKVKPVKQKIAIDEGAIFKKASYLSDMIDDVERIFFEGDFKKSYDVAMKIGEKIRKFRKCGLEHGGEFSTENLAFKALRRNGYLRKLSDLKTNTYDRMMSLNGGAEHIY